MLGLTDPSMFYENLKQRLAERIPMAHVDDIEQLGAISFFFDFQPNPNFHINFLFELGLLDETPVVKMTTPIDTLSNYLSKRLAFGKLI